MRIKWLLLIVVVVLGVSWWFFLPQPPRESFTLANWNLQVFGDTKASKPELMAVYAQKIQQYDIVFIQEIRDIDGSAWEALCTSLINYSCIISSRAGRSNSKEQYGVAFRNNITIHEISDYNPAHIGVFERPPLRVIFGVSGYNVTVYNIHVRPDSAAAEMEALEQLVSRESTSSDNVVVLGDMNADCGFYDESKNVDFARWKWVIEDWYDTTTSRSECTYDRIIINAEAFEEYVVSDVDASGIDTQISDHYLVWVALEPREAE